MQLCFFSFEQTKIHGFSFFECYCEAWDATSKDLVTQQHVSKHNFLSCRVGVLINIQLLSYFHSWSQAGSLVLAKRIIYAHRKKCCMFDRIYFYYFITSMVRLGVKLKLFKYNVVSWVDLFGYFFIYMILPVI